MSGLSRSRILLFDHLAMFEPHLIDHASDHTHDNDHTAKTLLEELDKIAPIKSFDAFPKVQSTYTSQSRRGGVLTTLVGLFMFMLVLVSDVFLLAHHRMIWESTYMATLTTHLRWITSLRRICS